MKRPSKTGGMTLVELLIATALLSVVILMAMRGFLSTNKLVEADTARVSATQNVQSAMDIMVADIRQAGENFTSQNIQATGIDFSNSAKQIIVRRVIPTFKESELPENYPATAARDVYPMKVCAITGNNIEIANSSTSCGYNPVDLANPSSDDSNVAAWRQFFVFQEGRHQAALLYIPGTTPTAASVTVTQVNPVVVSSVVSGGVTTTIRKATITLASAIPSQFTATNGSTIILVDEHRYKLDTANRQLLYTQGGSSNTATMQPLAFGVNGLTVNAILAPQGQPETSITEESVALDQSGYNWANLKQINLTVSGESTTDGKVGSRTFEAKIFPRNVETARGNQ